MLETRDYGRTWTATDVPVAKGTAAGVFTLAAADGRIAMALGGDLDARAPVSANAAVPTADGRWERTGPAPVPGAVYGSAVAEHGVLAVGPPGAAYTADEGASWHALDGVSAWAVEFAPGGRVGWAAGANGRVWRIEWAGDLKLSQECGTVAGFGEVEHLEGMQASRSGAREQLGKRGGESSMLMSPPPLFDRIGPRATFWNARAMPVARTALAALGLLAAFGTTAPTSLSAQGRVDSLKIVSSAGTDSTYAAGDTIKVRLWFSVGVD